MICQSKRLWVLLGLVVGLGSTPLLAAEAKAAEELKVDYHDAVNCLKKVVDSELKRGILAGVGVALVDDQQIVFAGGFGLADKRRNLPAEKNTVYRAGSISKLFTAIAAMQLVEQGKLDVDQPVTTYAPDFRIVVPFGDAGQITLRQLMCHRSGMVRESPIGGYLDPNQPGIAATVASVAPCVLVHPPDTVTKYSNVGPTITGHVVERVAALPYPEYQRKHVLGPLRMKSSSFLISDRLRKHLAPGNMFVADGKDGFREIEAPLFELGTLPAGNLYTTPEDLARFLEFLFAEGRVDGKQLLQADTLREMFTPQLTSSETGFGLAFHVEEYRGYKTIGHSGAVYGHSTSLLAIPEQKIGVVVLANEDIAMGPVRKLTHAAMDLMIEAKLGKKPEPPEETVTLKPEELARIAGDYESESYWARIEIVEGEARANVAGQRFTLAALRADKFLADGRFATDSPLMFNADEAGKVLSFTALKQTFHRVDPDAAAPIPEDWKKFLGSYGPEFIPLVISVKHGHLYAMTENMVDYRLTPLCRSVFKMPPGMYVDEQLVFQVGPGGKVRGAVLANMGLRRRPAR